MTFSYSPITEICKIADLGHSFWHVSEWKNTQSYLGVVTYNNICEALHVSPQNAVIRGLCEPTFSLRHRNLGPLNIRPVTIALVVR